MKRVAIVQARMASQRFPGKALALLDDRPLLEHVLVAAKRSSVDEVVLATGKKSANLPLLDLAEFVGVNFYMGSEDDVLQRVREAADHFEADVIVRLTGDCPLHDPEVIDRVLNSLGDDYDMASNILRRTYPKGLDTEVLHKDVLARIDRLASTPEAREHVTWFAYRERPDLFVLRGVEQPQPWALTPEQNWSVDTPADLAVVREQYVVNHERHHARVR